MVGRRTVLLGLASVATVAAALAAAIWPAGSAYALTVPPAPTDIPVVDQTGTLDAGQKQALATKIAKERTDTGNQIAILMVGSLDGTAIEDYSLQVARGWGIGQKDRNSGVLVLVAKNDHKLRIEVGYGLEGALPDITASHIITERITPQFKQGKYYEGLDSGLDGIILAIHGEKDPKLSSGNTAKPASKLNGGAIETIFYVAVFGFVWLGSVLARTKSWWGGGVVGGIAGIALGAFFGLIAGAVAVAMLAPIGLVLDKLVSDNYQKAAKRRGSGSGPPSWWAGGPWLGGGNGGIGGGGGFGGFGGGSFGGGGSSGSW